LITLKVAKVEFLVLISNRRGRFEKLAYRDEKKLNDATGQIIGR
jgi:hypothetical protein